MAFKIYDLDENTFLVSTDEDEILFGYSCDVKFLTNEIEVSNLKCWRLTGNTYMSEIEISILEDAVSDRKCEIEAMIIEYWIKERMKESDE